MCTVILLVRPGHECPVLLAANRDELLDRPWDPPGAHWPERPSVVAGRDRLAGGTWMGVNRSGVVAAVLNRPGSLGPASGKRSRGELPLTALESTTAAAGTARLLALDAASWRPFNMVIADRAGAWFVRGLGRARPQGALLGAGVHVITSHDPNDGASPRVRRHLPRFRAAAAPVSGATGDLAGWEAWRLLLADRGGDTAEQLNIAPRGRYGTSSAALLRLQKDGAVRWWFAAGPPDAAGFAAVRLPWEQEPAAAP